MFKVPPPDSNPDSANNVWRMRMTKKDMIHAIADKTGMPLKESEIAFTAMVDIIVDEIAAEKKASVSGLGTFEVRNRSARTGRNFRTGEAVKIPESNSVGFRAGKNLKEMVNKD